ncbi:MAG TPA: bifunctional metallophosphatase/5'-nucleotidase [Ruminococcaceae bacterium]|nr:bifunctional metallophosphatase/5'-nucleotidase [Oscillospiraceae bacterium]
MKKIASFLTSITVLLALILTFPVTAFAAETESLGVVILHTNDVHCGFEADDSTFGAADLAAYKARLESEGYDVILADAGDFVQGGVIGTLSNGEYPMQIMNELGYDVAIPGNHEFDFGMDNFLKLANEAKFPYISVNFTDLRTDEKPFSSYKIIEAGGLKIAFIGLTTPETPSSSTPTNFMDENGNYIYGFLGGDDGTALYTAVQDAINSAYADGADYVFAIGHMGDYVYDEKWSSRTVIKHTSGLSAFIDGHSHSVLEDFVEDKDGKSVPLASTGTKLENIGKITITDNEMTCELIEKSDYTVSADENTAENKAYRNMTDFIAGINAQYGELIGTVVARTDVELTINDPETGERAVRSAETNLGDLCADAYRAATGAEIALVNGGGVRANIAVGDITYGNIIDVQPFGNSLCVVEATGQQILDCLEMGALHCPEEDGSFIQVSGLTYQINKSVPSSVKTDKDGNFIGIDGEYRVCNVFVGEKPLDLNKTYTVASHNYYLLSYGGGMTMFRDCKLVAKEIALDNQALIDYITENLGGTVGEEYSNPRGSGRIKVIDKASDISPETGVESVAVFVNIAGIAAAMMVISRRKKG